MLNMVPHKQPPHSPAPQKELAFVIQYSHRVQSQWFGEGAMRQKASTAAQRLVLALRQKRELQTPGNTIAIEVEKMRIAGQPGQ
ncbi:hypothetical protein K469DRAFT_238636 [Zopfia rhizophila CBS 207.26]|uniref:Uncharacterized protein n=1 Tax=Zopfia rhizophila CBS 207.26 TaxID=1314779 RepID=A0A6A6EUK8_9PEZI|nr:hypothetical protein K469DRAFT_238636 [Zopfia rhizophila CBS 207.26]